MLLTILSAADACPFGSMRTCALADTWFTFLEHNVFPKTPTRQDTFNHCGLMTYMAVANWPRVLTLLLGLLVVLCLGGSVLGDRG